MALSAVPQFTRASICYSAPNTSSPKNIVFYSFGLQNCFSGWDDWDICPLVLLVFIFLLSIFCLFWCLVLVLCLCLFFVLMLFGVWFLCFAFGCVSLLVFFLCKCFLVFGVCALLFLVLYSFGVFFVLMLFGVWCLCFATPLLNQVAAQGPAACRLCRFQTNRFLLYSVHCNAQCTLYNSIHNAR